MERARVKDQIFNAHKQWSNLCVSDEYTVGVVDLLCCLESALGCDGMLIPANNGLSYVATYATTTHQKAKTAKNNLFGANLQKDGLTFGIVASKTHIPDKLLEAMLAHSMSSGFSRMDPIHWEIASDSFHTGFKGRLQAGDSFDKRSLYFSCVSRIVPLAVSFDALCAPGNDYYDVLQKAYGDLNVAVFSQAGLPLPGRR